MTICTISIDSTGPDATLYRTVLASLRNSYRLVDAGAEVVLMSATDPAKVERVCGRKTRAVVIDQPGLLSSRDVAAIADTAERRGCIVVPATRYGPRASAAADLLGTAQVDLLDCTINSGDALRSSLVEQLAVLRALLAPVESVRVLHASVSHYVLQAMLADHPLSHVLLNGQATSRGVEEMSLHAVGPECRLSVRIDAGPLARPAEICCYDGSGGRSPWPLHQHGHRITLARLHRLLTTGEGDLSYSLQDLDHDVQLAAALIE